MKVRNNILLVMFYIFLLLFLVACSEEDTETALHSFSFMIPGEGSSLDPNLTNETYSTAVLHHLYQGLVTIDANGATVNAAAESIEITEGNTYFVFKLRDDLKWSDGQSVTAHDYKRSWMRFIDPLNESQNASVISPYVLNVKEYIDGEVGEEEVGIYVVDDLTLAVRTKTPTPFLVDILTHSIFFPTRNESVMKGEDWSISPEVITNGAFVIDEYIEGSHVLLKKNPNYYDSENVKLDQLKFVFRSQESDIVELYNTKEIDGLFEITAAELRRIPDSELETNSDILPSTAFMTFNHDNELMSNLKFRKAISIAIDRQTIVEDVLSGAGFPSKYLVPFSYRIGGQQFRDYTELVDGPKVEEALQLIQELRDEGIYDNRPVTFHYMLGGPDAQVSEEIVKQLEKDLQIDFEVIGLKWADLYDLSLNDDYDMLMMGWGADYPHPMTFLTMFEKGSFYAPITRWRDLEYEAMLKDYLLITDEEKGLEYLRGIEDRILDGYHVVPIYHRKSLSLISQKLKGWHHGSIYFNFNNAGYDQ